MGDERLVLCVDGDQSRLDSTAQALSRAAGFGVQTAETTRQAVETVASVRVDCLVTAYDLPRNDGVELVRDVRADHGALPVVLFPADGSESVASAAVAAGATRYVPGGGNAPFDRLADSVRDAVGGVDRETVERARSKLATFFEEVPDPVFEYVYRDGEPYIVSANQSFQETFGYDAAEIEGDPVDEVLVPTEKLPEARALDERVRAGDDIDAEVVRETADGRREFLFRNVRVDDTEGPPSGYAVYTDITTQKQREQTLVQRNEQLDEFTSVVSHDLRNPMEVIKTRIEVTKETGDLSHLSHAIEAVDRMEELLSNLRTLAQQGDTVGETEQVFLSAVADDAWAHVETGSATLSVDCDATVDADAGRLTQLLENLFTNAVENADDPRIDVGVIDDYGFYVADDGPGIQEPDREHVFDYGFSSRDSGTGLGLSIVRRIAHAHDWEVTTIESEDGGARFEFRGVDVG